MSPSDLGNGAFELLGALLVLNHCRAVLRDRTVKGVSTLSTAAFTAWGFWNLYFYPHLGQWMSFAGGCLLVLANALYVALLLRFRERRPVDPADGTEATFDRMQRLERAARRVRGLYADTLTRPVADLLLYGHASELRGCAELMSAASESADSDPATRWLMTGGAR